MADEFLKMDMEVTVEIDADWARFGGKLQNVIEIAARHIELDAKHRISTPPTRAMDSGTTFNTIQSRKQDSQGLVWRVGPTTEYAPFIEFGTWKMRARPFMVPSAEKERPRVEKAITELFKDL